MSKAVKLKNSLYLASTSIVHKRGGGWYYLNNLLDNIYPVGSIFISTVNTNPSTYFGGTWEEFGTGRCLVGVDTSQSEFNSVEKTGGSKYLQSHNHNIWQAAGSEIRLSYGGGGTYNKIGLTYNWDAFPDNESFISTTDVNSLSTGNSGNLQPYITVYMWKRVS